jgi:hypothetical protein
MIQVNAVPDRAASFVVHPTPGIGDATTLADALLLLQQVGGGDIFVREGTYPVSATVTLPAGIPVTIRGCGDATIFSLGANAIPLFTIPTGATANTPIRFCNFKVTGTEVATQAVLRYNDNNGLAEVFMDEINTTGVEITINSDSTAQASATPGQDDPRFHMMRCRIRPCATNNSVILTNASFGVPRCWMTEVEFIGDSLFAVPGGRSAPLFGRIADDTYFGDLYMVDCEMSVGTGEHDFAVLEVVNSTIWNNDNVNTNIEFFMFGSFSSLGNNGSIRGSNLRRIYFELEEDGIVFAENYLQNCPIGMFGQGNLIGDNHFEQSGTWPVSHPFVIEVNNENTVIRHNKFEITTAPTNVVVFNAPCTFTGNDLSDVNNPAGGTLLMQNGAIFVTNNRFEFATITGPSVNDGNGGNYYSDNEDLFTNKTGGGPIVDPIIGDGNQIQGTSGGGGTASVGGTATNSIVVWYRNRNGLAQTKGYIHNTGANNITVRQSFITDTLGTFTKSTVLTPGSKLTLDPFDLSGLGGLGTGDFQVVDYRVDVSGTTIAWYLFFPKPNGVNRGSN